MRQNLKRLFAAVIAAAVTLTVLPAAVWAAEPAAEPLIQQVGYSSFDEATLKDIVIETGTDLFGLFVNRKGGEFIAGAINGEMRLITVATTADPGVNLKYEVDLTKDGVIDYAVSTTSQARYSARAIKTDNSTVWNFAGNIDASPLTRQKGKAGRYTLFVDAETKSIDYYIDGVYTYTLDCSDFKNSIQLVHVMYFYGRKGPTTGVVSTATQYVAMQYFNYYTVGNGDVEIVGASATENDEVVVAFAKPLKDGAVSITGDKVSGTLKAQNEINSTFTVPLSGLAWGESYNLTVSATTIDGEEISETLTGTVRKARSAITTLGVYDTKYAEDAEPLDVLTEGKVSAAVRIENEVATPLKALLGFAVYDAENNMVAFDTLDADVAGETASVVKEIPLDLSVIDGASSCTYQIFVWDSKNGMLPYGYQKAPAEGFKVESAVDNSTADKTLTITASGYAAADAGKPVSVWVTLDGTKDVYVAQLPLTAEKTTSVTIPLPDSGTYAVRANAPLLATEYTNTHRVMQDEDAETIRASINKAKDGSGILSEIKKNTLDEIFDFAPYDALPGTEADPDAGKKKACDILYNSMPEGGFASMSDFYNGIYKATITAAFVLDMDDDTLVEYVQKYDKEVGFSDYKAYSAFVDKDTESAFKTAVIERLEKYTIDSPDALIKALAGAIVCEQIYTAENFTHVDGYLKGCDDLLKLDYTEYETVKDAVRGALAGKSFDTYNDLIVAFEAAVDAAIEELEEEDDDNSGSGGGFGGGGGGGGFASSGAYYGSGIATEKDLSVEEEAVNNDQNQPVVYFNDLQGYDWATTYINELYKMNIISGKGDKMFAPADSITRAEFAKMMVGAFELADATYDGFSDVTTEDWYYPYVGAAYAAGLIQGTGDGMFGANDVISRQDAIVIAFRALNIEASNAELTFKDKDAIADYAVSAVAELCEAGIISGNEKNEFLPNNNLNRAEAAKIIYTLLTKEVK